MLEVNVGSSKYDKIERDRRDKRGVVTPGLKPVRLICVTDGAVMTHYDDGPADPSKPANPSRQKLIAAITKRIVVNGKKVPVFYAEREGVEVYDNNAGRMVEAAVYDDKARAITEGFRRLRSDAQAQHAQQFKGEVKNLRAKNPAPKDNA